jgi:hypothetical protein
MNEPNGDPDGLACGPGRFRQTFREGLAFIDDDGEKGQAEQLSFFPSLPSGPQSLQQKGWVNSAADQRNVFRSPGYGASIAAEASEARTLLEGTDSVVETK